ncbi:MAG: alpha/beta fold hydrolase [Acidimicrobiales bacterium]
MALPGGLTLSCALQGAASDVALVLLPGPTDSWRSYAPILDLLPPSIRTVAVSLRGHGDSDKPGSGYRVADLAGDVVPLLDALEVERAVLAGHSGSCLVARRVAIESPERVAGLVLEASPTTLRGHAGLEELVASVISGLEDPIDPAFARSVILDTSTDDLDHDTVELLVQDLLQVPARVWRELFADLLRYDDTAELARIRAPALLLWGDADELVGRAAQDQLARDLPRAELVVYPGLGHTPRWEDPAAVATDVAAFVERCIDGPPPDAAMGP